MIRLRLPACIVVVILTGAPALAAGGGGSAGGAGAQNQPASGLPLGEAGPVGSTNNPRKTATPDHPSATTTTISGTENTPPTAR